MWLQISFISIDVWDGIKKRIISCWYFVKIFFHDELIFSFPFSPVSLGCCDTQEDHFRAQKRTGIQKIGASEIK